jgi:hypothetical protein
LWNLPGTFRDSCYKHDAITMIIHTN